MLIKRQIIFYFLVLISVIAYGQQTIIKGQIIDADTDEPLPFATAQFTGTTIGTTTDLDGFFELSTNNPLLKSITLSYVGYHSKEIKFDQEKIKEKVFKLKPLKFELDEVEIKGKRRIAKDTAAIELYKRVVENKYRNDPSNYDFIQYKQYAKTEFGLYNLSEKFKEGKLVKRFDFVLQNIDTTESGVEVLPILLKETSEQYYYRKDPARIKSILLGDRFSGVENFSVGDLVDFNFENIEIYNNLIRVNGKPVMSPFADNARLSYKYFLTDTAVIDDLICYKLEFTGKGNAEAAFSGYCWIHDSTFAIKSIKLIVLPNANLNFVSEFIVQQDFKLLDGQFWIKDYEFLQTEYNLFKKKDEDKQSFLVRKTVKRTDLSVNHLIDDKIFEGEERIVTEDARKQNDAFWDTMRTDKLKPHEVNIFKTVDSIQNSGFYKAIRWFTYLGSSGWMDGKYLEFGRIYQIYSWNAVEGDRFRLTVRTMPEISKRVRIAPYFAYGTKDKTWKYGIDALTHLNRKNEKWHMLGVHYSYDMTQLKSFNPILRPNPPTYDNLAASILRSSPLTDLFLLRHASVFYEKEWLRGFNTRLAFDHKINYSVPTGTTFTTSDAVGDTTSVAKFTTSEFTFNFVWAKGLKFYSPNFGRYPVVSYKPIYSFDYITGVKGLFGSEYSYYKLQVGVSQRLLGPIGYTVYYANAGIMFGKAPYPLLTFHNGNESYLYDQYAYNVMNESEFVSDKFASLSIVHHFDGFVFDRIPGISKLQLRWLFSYRVLYGHLDKKNAEIFNLPDETSALNSFYMEAGFGIENILKVIKVDMLFRITQRDQPNVNKWAIRFAFVPNF